MNKENFETLITFIETELSGCSDLGFKMSVWYDDDIGGCGTFMCIGGSAAHILSYGGDPYAVLDETLQSWLGLSPRAFGALCYPDAYSSKVHSYSTTREAAVRLLKDIVNGVVVFEDDAWRYADKAA